MERHWLGLRRALEQVMSESLTVMTRSRIFDIVFRRTMIRKDQGESYEAFPGLPRMTPFMFFNDGGWYPKDMMGDRRFRRMSGLMMLTLFYTE